MQWSIIYGDPQQKGPLKFRGIPRIHIQFKWPKAPQGAGQVQVLALRGGSYFYIYGLVFCLYGYYHNNRESRGKENGK